MKHINDLRSHSYSPPPSHHAGEELHQLVLLVPHLGVASQPLAALLKVLLRGDTRIYNFTLSSITFGN